MKVLVLTSMFMISSIASLSFAAEPRRACDKRAGAYLQSGFVEQYEADPCSIVVTTDEGKKVLKLDRYKIYCDGKTRIIFGFDDEHFPNEYLNPFKLEWLQTVRPGVVVESGPMTINQSERIEYVRVDQTLLNQMFQTARACIAAAK